MGYLGQFGWVLIGRVVAAALQAVTFALLARAVSPADFGAVAAVIGFAAVLVTLLNLGVSTFVVRERARSRTSPALVTAMRVQRLINANLLFASAAGLGVFGWWTDVHHWQMLPLAAWVAAERVADVRLSILLADGDASANTVGLVGRRVLALVLFTVLLGHQAPVFAFSLSMAGGAVASAIYAWVVTRDCVEATDEPPPFSHVISASRPFWLNSVAVQSRSLDVALVGLVGGPSTAGLYGAASRLTSPMTMVSTSMATVLLPAATRSEPSGDPWRNLRRPVYSTVGAMLMVALAVSALSPLLVPAVLGPAYAGAVLPIQIIAFGLPFAATVSLLGAVLQGLDRPRLVARTAVWSSGLVLLMMPIAAWTLGAPGAAACVTGGHFVQSLVLIAASQRLMLSRRAAL